MAMTPINWNEARNQWEGEADVTAAIPRFARYADIPDPSTRAIGDVVAVTEDDNEGLNGLHMALGNGATADFWRKV